MSPISCPLPFERLVDYWAHALPAEEVDAIDEHLLGCAECFEASSRIAALARGVVEVIPPIALGRDLAAADARGVHRATNDFQPGVPQEAWLRPGTDLLVHRLIGDLADVEKVSVDVVVPGGASLVSFDDVPFEPSEGAVLVACSRHFVEQFPPDVDIVVRRTHRAGRESVDRYRVHHRIAA